MGVNHLKFIFKLFSLTAYEVASKRLKIAIASREYVDVKFFFVVIFTSAGRRQETYISADVSGKKLFLEGHRQELNNLHSDVVQIFFYLVGRTLAERITWYETILSSFTNDFLIILSSTLPSVSTSSLPVCWRVVARHYPKGLILDNIIVDIRRLSERYRSTPIKLSSARYKVRVVDSTKVNRRQWKVLEVRLPQVNCEWKVKSEKVSDQFFRLQFSWNLYML